MSVPVGQSLVQPLHDRHRSSASCTSGDRQPPLTSRPSIISCSTRARPRVESFSLRVAWNDGHMTPLEPWLSARHLPTPVQRCTALPKSPSSWSSRRPETLVESSLRRLGSAEIGVERRWDVRGRRG